jgi:hypothetical protein
MCYRPYTGGVTGTSISLPRLAAIDRRQVVKLVTVKLVTVKLVTDGTFLPFLPGA